MDTPNLIIYSRRENFEYLDETIEILTANLLAGNLLAQVDRYRQRKLVRSKIINHKASEDIISTKNSFNVYSDHVLLKKLKIWDLSNL